MAMIVLVVCLALLVPTAQNVGDMTNTIVVANESLGVAVVNGTAQYLTNYRAISDVVIYNETGDALIDAGDYVVENNVVYNDALAVKITPDTSADQKSIWQVSGTAQPLSYASDSASRSMASLIVILASIGILGYSVYHFSKGFSNF